MPSRRTRATSFSSQSWVITSTSSLRKQMSRESDCASARLCAGRPGIRLHIQRHLRRGRARMRAPMIQDPRDVTDLAWLDQVRAAQQQIVILASFETEPKATRALNQAAAKNRQMRNVVLGQDQRRIPVRFEQRVLPQAAVAELVFIAIDNCRMRMHLDFVREPEQSL